MIVETDRKNEGTNLINEALEDIRQFIEGRKGTFKVKDAVPSFHYHSPKLLATRTNILNCLKVT
jgi:hypothetical protein